MLFLRLPRRNKMKGIILIPSFIFIAFADIFFLIISIFEGGIFRGWLAKKQ